jgi:uncharacterized membrane protein YecN with MAPEG domain
MRDLPVTSITAVLMAVIFLVLAARVGAARGKSGASLGDGSGGLIKPGEEHTAPLLVASRSHANFCEYVPLALILLALAEHNGAPRIFMLIVAGALVVARVIHPIGLGRKSPNPFRAGGALLSFVVIVAASVELVILAVR